MNHIVPGPPFVFGALLVILALMVAAFIPEQPNKISGFSSNNSTSEKDPDSSSQSAPSRRHYTSVHGSSEKKKLSLKSYKHKSDDEEELSDREYTVPLIHTETSSSSPL